MDPQKEQQLNSTFLFFSFLRGRFYTDKICSRLMFVAIYISCLRLLTEFILWILDGGQGWGLGDRSEVIGWLNQLLKKKIMPPVKHQTSHNMHKSLICIFRTLCVRVCVCARTLRNKKRKAFPSQENFRQWTEDYHIINLMSFNVRIIETQLNGYNLSAAWCHCGFFVRAH